MKTSNTSLTCKQAAVQEWTQLLSGGIQASHSQLSKPPSVVLLSFWFVLHVGAGPQSTVQTSYAMRGRCYLKARPGIAPSSLSSPIIAYASWGKTLTSLSIAMTWVQYCPCLSTTNSLEPASEGKIGMANSQAGWGIKVVADVEADAAYDVAARALAAEARGAAGDRVLGPEEQAERERARMEMLEKERCGMDCDMSQKSVWTCTHVCPCVVIQGHGSMLRRMRGTGGDEDVGPSGLGLPEGGYAARRLKLREKERQEGRSSGCALPQACDNRKYAFTAYAYTCKHAVCKRRQYFAVGAHPEKVMPVPRGLKLKEYVQSHQERHAWTRTSSSGDDEGASGSDDEGKESSSSDGEGEEGEEGARPGSELEKRRMEQAAGDHPLQNTFRWGSMEAYAEI
eukprot:scaffold277741_cov18-Tisochrysis_lutea.AAC.1